ncbi:unnamed protein product [Miscanthus lutarioriparius]|uniref:V-SNARE coiled-coil homology domain-containing protein n=1 Tax=Miscanthus lutarioriparius TaxID=422564 RepID=A0A811NSH7_9POAL|nr:unnamed protein product [Miscanthus lutarioriparius]
MKITALLVLKSPGDSSASASASGGGEQQQAVVLANASDVSHFGYFQRAAAREFILFVARTVALRTPAGSRQNVLEEYQKTFGESWRTTKTDVTQPWQYLDDALTKYQDPAEADKLLKIQRDLDETKIILHKTIDSVLARGERLDSLVEKSSDLSISSQLPQHTRSGCPCSRSTPRTRLLEPKFCTSVPWCVASQRTANEDLEGAEEVDVRGDKSAVVEKGTWDRCYASVTPWDKRDHVLA